MAYIDHADPNYMALAAPHCHVQVPVLSAIGKGPQGDKGDKGNPGIDSRYDFENVSLMMQESDLEVNDICHTLGFHEAGDGGAAYYLITDDAEANGIDIIRLNNGLFAELRITESYVTPEMFGAYGDGEHDDTDVLNYLFSFGNIAVVSPGGKTYLCSNAITVQTRRSINMNLSTIKFINSGNGFVIDVTEESDYSHRRFSPTIENIIIDGGNTAIAFYIYVGYKSHINNIYINNFKNVGMRKDTGYEMVVDNIWFWASVDSTNAIGLYVYGNDCEYGNIFGVNCHIGVKMRGGGNHFSFIHMWLFKDTDRINGDDLYADSAMIEIEGNDRYHIDYAYFDSFQYGIKYSGYGWVYINSALSLMANLTNLVSDFANIPTYLIYSDTEHLPYIRRIFISRLYMTSSQMLNKDTNYVIPNGYNSVPLHIKNAYFDKNTVTDNRPTNFIDSFTVQHGELIEGYAVPIDEQTMSLCAIIKQTDPNTRFSISYPSWVSPITVNIPIPTIVSTNQYLTGTNNIAALNVGRNGISVLSSLVNDGYYYVNVQLKSLFVA